MSSGIRPCLGIYLIGSGSFRILIPSLNNSLFETSCMKCVKGTDGEKTPGGCLLLRDFSGRSGFCCFCHVFTFLFRNSFVLFLVICRKIWRVASFFKPKLLSPDPVPREMSRRLTTFMGWGGVCIPRMHCRAGTCGRQRGGRILAPFRPSQWCVSGAPRTLHSALQQATCPHQDYCLVSCLDPSMSLRPCPPTGLARYPRQLKCHLSDARF